MTTRCSKCERVGDRVPHSFHAVCDLPPMDGYSGPCILKYLQGDLDLDDGEGGATIKPGTPKRKKRER